MQARMASWVGDCVMLDLTALVVCRCIFEATAGGEDAQQVCNSSLAPLASSTPPGAGNVAGAAVPGIDDGALPISDDQLPSPMSPPPSPLPTTSCAPTLLLCHLVASPPLASRRPPHPLSPSHPPPARLAPPSPLPLLLFVRGACLGHRGARLE